MCKLKKVSNTKKEEGQGEEVESDEDEAPPLEDWDANEVADKRAARAAAKGAKGAKAITASVETKSKVKKRSFNLEQSGECLVTHSCSSRLSIMATFASHQMLPVLKMFLHIRQLCTSIHAAAASDLAEKSSDAYRYRVRYVGSQMRRTKRQLK